LPENDAVTDVFDYLAGAIFSLQNCAALPFLNRKSKQLAISSVVAHPEVNKFEQQPVSS